MVKHEYESVGELCEGLGGHKKRGGDKCVVNFEGRDDLVIENGNFGFNATGPGNSVNNVNPTKLEIERQAARDGQKRGYVFLNIEHPSKFSSDTTREQFTINY
jgi:hypothetical protein